MTATAGAFAFSLILWQSGLAEGPGEGAEALPRAPGRDLVELYCAPCHSLKLVTQQGLSRKDWDELLVWMVDEQGMAEMPAEDRQVVLDYLASEISIERVREMRRGR